MSFNTWLFKPDAFRPYKKQTLGWNVEAYGVRANNVLCEANFMLHDYVEISQDVNMTHLLRGHWHADTDTTRHAIWWHIKAKKYT